MPDDLVRVKELRGTFGRKEPGGYTRYYGPGKNLLVPRSIARTVGAEIIGERAPSTGVADLPHAEMLENAGYTSHDAVPRTVDELSRIPGIGQARAREILEALSGGDTS